MTLLQRLKNLPSFWAFRSFLPVKEAYPATRFHGKLVTRCSEPCCRRLSTVDLNADSWRSGRKYIRGYENIPELESAPEEVKRVFSLQNANQFEHRKVAIEKAREQYTDDAERKIAELSLKIEAVKKHNNTGRNSKKDKHNKVFLNWLISQRKKKLGHLKNGRFERYLVLSKELDLRLLESPHTKWNKYKFRKFKIGVEIKEKKRFPK
ncbi:unnamed protein product [Porites lobata]|uniref:Small ribosomal subunit protein uS15m n=1 Tax=Porites lobata TaxID=104759 RepID=A0ABN8PX52_9CNID|nr:unnamed protein product [Porites lobata]